MQAQHEPVKNAVISVLQQSPDARAALQRAFAANGLSISLAPMVQPALPPAAAAIQTAPPKIQDITDEELEHEKTASSDLDGFIRAVLGTLEKFGDNVKGILRSFVARWKRRFGRLFNPGKQLCSTLWLSSVWMPCEPSDRLDERSEPSLLQVP